MPPETFCRYRTKLPAKTTVSDFSASESLVCASKYAWRERSPILQFVFSLALAWPEFGIWAMVSSRARVMFLSEMYIWPSARMTWCLGSTEYVFGCLVPSRRMYCLLSALMMTDGDVLAKPS